MEKGRMVTWNLPGFAWDSPGLGMLNHRTLSKKTYRTRLTPLDEFYNCW